MAANKCKKCGAERVARLSGKTSDLCFARVGEREHEGYVPTDMGICSDGDNDYINFDFCLECGQIQGRWPRKPCALEKPERAPKK